MAELTFWQLLTGAFRLDAETFRLADAVPLGSLVAFWVVLLAGVSSAIGQSAVLFINRIRPGRFVGSLLVSAVIYIFTYLFWTVSILLIARYVFGSVAAWGTVARAVGLGYAPQLFSFLAFMPFFGVPILILLSLWSLLAVIVGIGVTLGLPLWQALLCSVLGWLMLQFLERTVGRPVVAARNWLRRSVAGNEVVTDIHGLEVLTGVASDTDSSDGR